MVKYCPDCGTKVKETDKYCPTCGAKLYKRKKRRKTEKKILGSTWSKETRTICGVFIIIATLGIIITFLYIGGTVNKVVKQNPEMFSINGTPINSSCNVSADCVCEENSTSMWCNPAFFIWKCEGGSCVPVQSREAYFEEHTKQK